MNNIITAWQNPRSITGELEKALTTDIVFHLGVLAYERAYAELRTVATATPGFRGLFLKVKSKIASCTYNYSAREIAHYLRPECPFRGEVLDALGVLSEIYPESRIPTCISELINQTT